jgi:hypothetical protein
MFDGLPYEGLNFDDGRGKYPEPLKIQAPLGTRAKIKRVASAEGISSGELVRRAVSSYIEGGRKNVRIRALAYVAGA